MKTIEKVKDVLGSLEYDKEDKAYVYSFRYLHDEYQGDEDFDLIRTKSNAVVEKLNSIKNDKKKLNEYLNMDFEDEIWDTI